MWPVTSVRCDWFSFSCRLISARPPLSGPTGFDGAVFGGAIAGADVAVAGASVGAATTGVTLIGVALVGGGGLGGAAAGGGLIAAAAVWGIVDGAVFGGTIAGDDLAVVGFFAGAATTGGKTVGIALVGGGGFGGAAAESGVIGVAVVGGVLLGIRTDFLHRLQSNIFTVAAASTTSGAAQCGQSKRTSLLTVPVFDAPPFCIVGNGSSQYTIITASQLGAPDEILNSDFVPTWHSRLPFGNLILDHKQLIIRYL